MTDETLLPPTIDPADAAAAAARFAADAPADVTYATVDSPLGTLLVASTERGLVRLAYTDFAGGVDGVLDHLAARVSPRIVASPRRVDPVRRELDEYFAGRRTTFDVPLDWTLVGPFGRRILDVTAAIPFGQVRTYGQVAIDAGSPRGSRAAGRALGANPIPIIVPCHRVLNASGALHGYTGGLHRKEALLHLEGVLMAG